MNWKAFRLVSFAYLVALVIAFGIVVGLTTVLGGEVTTVIGRILIGGVLIKYTWDILKKNYNQAKEDLEKQCQRRLDKASFLCYNKVY